MPSINRKTASAARQSLYQGLRRFFARAGYQEVETPSLVPAPGMEPQIQAFETRFTPEGWQRGSKVLYLHTSPEYAMKRLLAEGFGPIFQICRAFRDGEVTAWHNPEFTLLELYRPFADYRAVMEDLERALAEATAGLPRGSLFSPMPYQRLTVREAVLQYAGIDLSIASSEDPLRAAAQAKGVQIGEADGFDDVFFHLFLQKVEPQLGRDRPTFLVDYPASMAALARLKPDDPRVAERFELYVEGVELANGFSELTDPGEQRRRLVEERALRQRRGRAAYPIDEAFLDAVGKMPPSGGVAVGLDRVLMLALGCEEIRDVLLFPAEDWV